MGLTLREQLQSLPLPQLTTVLRLSLPLLNRQDSFEKTVQVINSWWNEKAKPYETSFRPDIDPFYRFSRSGFRADFALTNDAFALEMEEPDSSVEGRTWKIEVDLTQSGEQCQLGLRASYRQPKAVEFHPDHRAPRFVKQIIDEVGAMDVWQLSSDRSPIGLSDAPYFIELLESQERLLPVVAISNDQGDLPLIDPARLAKLLAGVAHVVHLDGDATWELTKQLEKKWSVYHGGVRVYMPGFDLNNDLYSHKLWLADNIFRLNAQHRDGFINLCMRSIFSQVTADYESIPMLTPAALRKRNQEVNQAALTAVPIQPPEDAISIVPVISTIDESLMPVEEAAQVLDLGAELAYVERSEMHERIREFDEQLKKAQSELEEQRAARANVEKLLSETKSLLDEFEQENLSLQSETKLLRGEAVPDASPDLQPVWACVGELIKSMKTMSIKYSRVEKDAVAAYELESELNNARRENHNLKATIESLNRRTEYDNSEQLLEELRNIVPGLVSGECSLIQILEMQRLLHPDRLKFLDSAFESAKGSAFKNTGKAYQLIETLATKYWETVQENGDTAARHVFGTTNYAAKDKTTLSIPGKKRRTFIYNGEPIFMEQHLRLGTADNSVDTLRIHFAWIPDEQLIIVGHVGKHLDF